MTINSMSDLQHALVHYCRNTGTSPSSWVLSPLEFYHVCSDLFNSHLYHNRRNIAADLARVEVLNPLGQTRLVVVDGGATLTNTADIVNAIAVAQGYTSAGVGISSIGRLDIGPYAFAFTPRAVTNPFIPQQMADALLTTKGMELVDAQRRINGEWKDAAGSGVINDSEPECRCSSRALATTGHEAGCNWLAWRNRNRKD